MATVKVVGIVQARMGSTRLPGKALAPLAGTTVLRVVIERARRSRRVDEWWVATTTGADDDPLVAEAEALDVRIHRGSTEDVLSRFIAIVRETGADTVLRQTADNPFTGAEMIDWLLGAVTDPGSPPALVAGGPAGHVPLGYVPQVIDAASLVASDAETVGHPFHRTHVSTALIARSYATPLLPPSWPVRPHWRWTVDEPADLLTAQAAFAAFGPSWPTIRYAEMVGVLDAHPEITAGNVEVRQKAVEEG